MQVDKQILLLSTLALGFVLNFLNNFENNFEFGLWFFAGFAYTLTIGLVLWIFYKNSDYLGYMILEDSEKEKKEEKKLSRLSWLGYTLFFSGTVLTFFLIINKAYSNIPKQGTQMTEKVISKKILQF